MRRALPQSQASLARLAKHDALNPKTMATWTKRTQVPDAPMGPKHPRSTILTREEAARMVAFRQQTLRPLADCLYALQATLPHVTRAARHRCLQRHNISRLPDRAGAKPAKKQFQSYPIGSCHLDIAEVRTEAGKLYLGVAMDRACQLAYAEWHEQANTMVAAQFHRTVMAAIPDTIHTVLTDNGMQCTHRKREIDALHHLFDRVCHEPGIDHRLTNTTHPWTNGQVDA